MKTEKTALFRLVACCILAALSSALIAQDAPEGRSRFLEFSETAVNIPPGFGIALDRQLHLLLASERDSGRAYFLISGAKGKEAGFRLEAFDAAGASLLIENLEAGQDRAIYAEWPTLPPHTVSVVLSPVSARDGTLKVRLPGDGSVVPAEASTASVRRPSVSYGDSAWAIYNPSDATAMVEISGGASAVEIVAPHERLTLVLTAAGEPFEFRVLKGQGVHINEVKTAEVSLSELLASKHPHPGSSTTYPFLCGGAGSGNGSSPPCSGNLYTDSLIHPALDMDKDTDGLTFENRVFATLPGTVASFANSVTCNACPGWGNNVVVRHLLDDGRIVHSGSAHFAYDSNLQSAGLAAGDHVVGGQFLGYKGNTGRTSGSGSVPGSHLHLEIMKNGNSFEGGYSECSSHLTPVCTGERTERATGSTSVEDPAPYSNGSRRALLPLFSLSSATPNLSGYDVYGVANQRLYAALPFSQQRTEAWMVAGRSESGAVADIALPNNSGNTKTGFRDNLTSDGDGTDYRFYGYYNGILFGGGYQVKLTVLPNANSKIVDNNSASGFQGNDVDQSDVIAGYYYSALAYRAAQGQYASWRPSLSAGSYSIYVHVPKMPYGTKASAVRYKIYPSSGSFFLSDPISHASIANQNQWVKLTANNGAQQEWTLASTGYVGLSIDSSGGNSASGQLVAVDAVKFLRVGSSAPPQSPDFVVSTASLSPSSPGAGGTFSATVTVTNQGTAAGDGRYLDVWVHQTSSQSCGANGDKWLSVGSLAAGASKTFSFTGLTAPSAGNRTFRAYVDSGCSTTESNEGNNQLTKSYTVTAAQPDFVVTGISLSPSSPAAGGTFSATVTVANQGSAAGDGRYLDVWVHQTSSQSCGANGNKWLSVGSLAAGASKTFSFTGLTAPSAGNRTFRAYVDSGCSTTESNEGNNQLTKTYSVH